MANLSVGEIALLLGDSYDEFEDFLFTPAGERLKWQWERYENFDMGSAKIRAKLEELVTANIIARADLDRVYAESDKRDAATLPKIKPLATRPIVTLFNVGNGKGYEILAGYMKVRQDYAPALAGNYNMTTTEAQKLADFIADKMYAGLSPSVSPDQIQAVWDGTATSQQLIDEEKALMGV